MSRVNDVTLTTSMSLQPAPASLGAGAPFPVWQVNASPRSEIVAAVWQARKIVLAAMLLAVLCGLAASILVTPRYTATAKLLVLVSSQYAARRDPSDEAPVNAVMDRESFMQVETEILTSRTVLDEVVASIGATHLYPALAKRSLPPEKQQAAAVQRMAAQMSATADKVANVIVVTFTHKNPKMAAETVNAVVQAYLKRRQFLFSDVQSGAFAAQARVVRIQLETATRAYQRFKADHGISDYDTQRELLLHQLDDTTRELHAAQSALGQTGRRLETVQSGLAALAPQIEIYRDEDLQGRIDRLKSSLDDMRARESGMQEHYGDNSPALIDLRRQIATTARELSITRTDNRPTVIRKGRNPLFDSLELDQAQALQAQVEAQARIDIARRQAGQEQESLVQLDRQQVELQGLDRQRSLLEQQYRSILKALEERQLIEGVDSKRLTNVRQINDARSLIAKHDVRLAAIVSGLLASLFVGIAVMILGYVFRRGFATADAIERALGMPVFATIPRQAAESLSSLSPDHVAQHQAAPSLPDAQPIVPQLRSER